MKERTNQDEIEKYNKNLETNFRFFYSFNVNNANKANVFFWKCHIDVRDGMGRMKPVESRTSIRCMFQLPI